jgi:hypothetical protein
MVTNNSINAKTTTGTVVAGNGTGFSNIGYSTIPSASTITQWDSNSNISSNSFIEGYATTATVAGTTTLTVSSMQQQYFTGTTTQAVLLPVTSTLVLGQSYTIVNNSTGVVTVQSSGSNTVQAMLANTILIVTCILTSGTSASSWSSEYYNSTPTPVFQPNSIVNIKDDFIVWVLANSSPTGILSELCWTTPFATSWSGGSTYQNTNNPGVIANTTSLNPSLFPGFTNANYTTIVLGGGQISVNWVINTAILSTVLARYTLKVGLSNIVNSTTAFSDGVFFQYSDNINSGNWVGVTSSASTTTNANSSVAATPGFINLGMIINSAGTSVSFYINGVQISGSPISTNIPTVSIYPFLTLNNVVGNAGTVLVDLFYLSKTLTTPR